MTTSVFDGFYTAPIAAVPFQLAFHPFPLSSLSHGLARNVYLLPGSAAMTSPTSSRLSLISPPSKLKHLSLFKNLVHTGLRSESNTM